MHVCGQVIFESRQEVAFERVISDFISLRSRPSRIPFPLPPMPTRRQLAKPATTAAKLRDRLVIPPRSLPAPPPSLLASTATPRSRAASCARENLRTMTDDRLALIAGALDDRLTFHHEMTSRALLFISKLRSSGCQVLSITSPLPSRMKRPTTSLAPVPLSLKSFIVSPLWVSPQELLEPWVVSFPPVIPHAVRVVALVTVSATMGPPIEVAKLSLVAAKVSTGHHGWARSISLREPKSPDTSLITDGMLKTDESDH